MTADHERLLGDSDGSSDPAKAHRRVPGSHRPAKMQLDGLTSLRGIAAWWVVIYHFREFLPDGTPRAIMALASSGYLAVDFFFALSGFVIALNYAHRLQYFSMRSAGRFLALRLARIYPLHAVLLMLFLINPLAITMFSHGAALGQQYSLSYYLLSILLLQCWGFSDTLAWNVPAWSISTEFGAYLAFPLLAICCASIGKTRVRSFILVIALVVMLLTAACLNGGLNVDIPHFGLLRCLLEFSSGCALLQFVSGGIAMSDRGSALLALVAAILLIAAIAGIVPDWCTVPPSMLMLLFSVQSRPSWAVWLLERRTLIWAGEISYSTYMIHYFIKDWVKFLVVSPATPHAVALGAYIMAVLAGSAVLYRFVEVPSRVALRRRIG